MNRGIVGDSIPGGVAAGGILVVGDVIDDIVVFPSGPIVPDTDTRSTIRRVAGGSAANTAAWLAELGCAVTFVGAVGTGEAATHAALLPGVDARLHEVHAPTGTIIVLVDGESRALLSDRGANALLDLDAIDDDMLRAHVHLTGHTMAASDGAAFARLIRRAKDAGATVSVNPGSVAYIVALGAERFREVIAGADVLIATLTEGRALAGLDGGEDASAADPSAADPNASDPSVSAAEVRAALEIPTVVLTRGREGAVVDGMPVAAASATVIDPTGAGDAFCAGFLARWTAGADPVDAAQFGAEVAARARAIVGGRPR